MLWGVGIKTKIVIWQNDSAILSQSLMSTVRKDIAPHGKNISKMAYNYYYESDTYHHIFR